MTRSTALFAVLVVAAPLACVSTPGGRAASSASCQSVLVTVDCGPLHRVDTRWELTFDIVHLDGGSATAHVNVPPDSTASEIASSMASAIEAACDLEASSTQVDANSSRVELVSTRVTFGAIRLVEFERRVEDRPGIGPYVVHKEQKPLASDDLRITKLDD